MEHKASPNEKTKLFLEFTNIKKEYPTNDVHIKELKYSNMEAFNNARAAAAAAAAAEQNSKDSYNNDN